MTRPTHDTEPQITKEMLEEMRKHVARTGFEGEMHIEITREALHQLVEDGKNLKREVGWDSK